ncbi:MAG TPA: hypothetical protein VH592_06095 [Gemmataceae bacterium]|jgi:hypothetical protein
MDWQLLLVMLLVSLALAYLGRRTLRTWLGKGAGCGSCKCPGSEKTGNAASQTLIPLDQVRLRRR